MRRYLLGKLGQAVFVIWAAYTFTFVLLYVLPANPVDLMFDPTQLDTISAADKQAVAQHYGFDKPLYLQYLTRLLAAAHGDFGTSTQNGEPVWSAIAAVVPRTIALASAALLIAVLIAFAVALAASLTGSRWLANLLASLPPAAVSVPVFLIGLVALQLFSFQLAWFPPFGTAGLRTLILPALTLAIPVSGPIAQLLAKNLARELHAPYVTTSIAKGATRPWVLVRDVLKNASLPALTIAGVTLGNLLAGAVIVETIYSRSGLGRLTETAVRTQDVPLVQGVVIFAALVFVLVNLAVDLVYPLVDPRLRARILAG